MTTIEPAPKVDLTNCDREPIHIPGSIQPHGCLLACDVSARAVLRHSANAAAMLKIDGRLTGRKPEVDSFLGQYFPASDIPQQARQRYLRNTIRVISDANFERIPIDPVLDVSGEPLDLSFAHLRSVSPIHCEYLRNMGVCASMSISIIVNGALWGLIACHHYSPRVLSMAERVAAEMFGEFFSLHLSALRQASKLEAATRARRSLDRFLSSNIPAADVDEAIVDNLPDFATLMPCDGAAVWLKGKSRSVGSTPLGSGMAKLARFAVRVTEGRVWATHILSNHLPAAEGFSDLAAGRLFVPLAQPPPVYLFFFRHVFVHSLYLAGNPVKSYETGPLGDRLTPRKSFAIWKETVHRQSAPWTEDDREIAEATRTALVEFALRHSELLEEERAKADVRQRMLNEELNHRVKNILAVIKSLVGFSNQEGQSLEEYVRSLRGRIQALAFAHDQ